MEVSGLKGPRVTLAPLDRGLHLENALRWMNDAGVTATLATNLGISRRQEEAFFDRAEAQREADLHWGIHDERGRHIGLIGLNEVNWKFRKATGGIVIGERDAWGLGYATEAVAVRTRLAFEQMGLHRVEGHTIHPAMARVYAKCGYRREGLARQLLWRDGVWKDAELFAILDADYFAGREAALAP